jgi:hypothetical protein
MFVKLIPHSLHDEKELRWLDDYKDFVQPADGEPPILNTIIIKDKSWHFHYYPETKDKVQNGESSVRPYLNIVCWLLNDNAPAHSKIDIRAFLAKKKKRTAVLNHSPQSTNLAPADLFLFLELKSRLKGH